MKLKTRTNQPVEGDELENLKVSGDLEVEGDAKVFETIVDSEGHNRFIEGDITLANISGLTQTYGKWSLSGTHLMIALAFTISSGTSLGTVALSSITIPEWLGKKIYSSGDTEKQVAVKYADEWLDNNVPQEQHLYCGIQKLNDTTLQLARWGLSTTFANETYVRIAFDLLIDNESEE